MAHTPIEALLNDLDSPNRQEAWAEFLSVYSSIIYQVVRHFESDLDNAADCFQFVCERLIENSSRRLRKFRGEGSATFTTWLRAVVRNLCIDWHRKQYGRQRQFQAISRLSFFDREVFRVVYERATPLDESVDILSSQFPKTTIAHINESRSRIEEVLTPNQRWILVQRLQNATGNGASSDEMDILLPTLESAQPSPELQAIDNERKRKLNGAIASLSADDRMLIRLRFEEGLTLGQAAELLGLGNAQRADRQVKDILARLKKLLS